MFLILWCALGMFAGLDTAAAATLNIVANRATPEINQPVRLDIKLDTQGDDANAIQAEVDFPADLFVLQSINDGASPVSFWIEPPTETASGVVAFSGVIPGGFDGAASSVVSLWLLPTAPGSATIALSGIQLFRNDGQATPISVSTTPAEIVISNTMASGTRPRPVSFVTPNPFTPVISRDPDLFNGQYFLSFSTTDKGSGISYYEVLETPKGSGWQMATSPYLLQDQALSSNIYVRAVDHAGNFIVTEIPAENPKGEQGNQIWDDILFIALCLLLVILVFILWKKLRWHRKKV